jgi:hypothetical protein
MEPTPGVRFLKTVGKQLATLGRISRQEPAVESLAELQQAQAHRPVDVGGIQGTAVALQLLPCRLVVILVIAH